jgi:hypothetical protein
MIEDESAPYDMSIHSNSSALAWTKFFREHNPECNLDDDVMLGWFANAMMAMHNRIYQTTQPEQEPVAWMNDSGGCFLSDGNKYSEQWTPLYTAPQKREPLSEDKLDVLAEANITDEGIAGYYLGFRDAEKYHGIGAGE